MCTYVHDCVCVCVHVCVCVCVFIESKVKYQIIILLDYPISTHSYK